MSDATIRAAFFDQIDNESLYKTLQLRSQVFGIEQKILYQDLDDRDREPGTLHMWIEENSQVLSCLRVLRDPDGLVRIGRVCTAISARGRGLAASLISDVIENETGLIEIHAQTYLERWYQGFGFAVSGPGFLEEGQDHVPMQLRR